jgi:hypothetical protein
MQSENLKKSQDRRNLKVIFVAASGFKSNFIIVIQAAFTQADPESARRLKT